MYTFNDFKQIAQSIQSQTQALASVAMFIYLSKNETEIEHLKNSVSKDGAFNSHKGQVSKGRYVAQQFLKGLEYEGFKADDVIQCDIDNLPFTVSTVYAYFKDQAKRSRMDKKKANAVNEVLGLEKTKAHREAAQVMLDLLNDEDKQAVLDRADELIKESEQSKTEKSRADVVRENKQKVLDWITDAYQYAPDVFREACDHMTEMMKHDPAIVEADKILNAA